MFTRASEAEDEGLVSSHCNKRRVVDVISAQFSLVDGNLYRICRVSKRAAPVRGFRVGPYLYVKISGNQVPVHRVVAILSTGRLIPDGMVCDHIDGNPLNNSESNIRVVPAQMNRHNTKVSRKSTTGHTGITKTKWGTYKVCHTVSGQIIHAGTFKSMEVAISARNESFAMFAPEKLACIQRRGEGPIR